MFRLRYQLFFALVLTVFAFSACDGNPIPEPTATPPFSAVPPTIAVAPLSTPTQPPTRLAPAPTAQTQFTSTPRVTPTDIPIPIKETYKIDVMYSCGMGANGNAHVIPNGFALCFLDPGYFDQIGTADYFILMVTQRLSDPHMELFHYGWLEGFVKTPTPTITWTPSATPTSGPSATPTFGPAPTYGPINPRPTPVKARTITIDVTGYCETPTSSATMTQVNICFSVRPGRDWQLNIEYWTITVTRDLVPVAKSGLLSWAPPIP